MPLLYGPASASRAERVWGKEGENLFHSVHWYFIIGILVTTEILHSLSGLLNPGMINFYKAIPLLIVIYFRSGSFETCFLEGSKVTHMRSHCVMFCDQSYLYPQNLLASGLSINILFLKRFSPLDFWHVTSDTWNIGLYLHMLSNW